MGRAPCCDKSKVKRGPWSPEEDNTLKKYLQQHGSAGNWIALPQKAGLKRCGKSCRLRWLNYLRPDIKHGGFTEEEDRIILTLYTNIGSRWSVIASHLPGRTDNDVKNYWNTKLKKKLLAAAATTTTITTNNDNNVFTQNVPMNFTTAINFSGVNNSNSSTQLIQDHYHDQFPLPSLMEVQENYTIDNNNQELVSSSAGCYSSSSFGGYYNETNFGTSSSSSLFVGNCINGGLFEDDIFHMSSTNDSNIAGICSSSLSSSSSYSSSSPSCSSLSSSSPLCFDHLINYGFDFSNQFPSNGF